MQAGVPSQAMVEFIRALSYDVDFQRELKEGMKFTVLLEQLVTSDGRVTHPGRLLAGELRLLKRTVTVIRYPAARRRRRLLQSQGRERRALLPAHADGCLEDHLALRHARASDPGLQRHCTPASISRAPPGTPILAAGAGKVAMAGPNGGYGLYVKLQHTSDVATAYAHMSRIGPGIKPGVAVRQGQVIGFVGSTGMSTGPHLHYEFHRGGRQVNPLAQKFAMRAAGRRQGRGALPGAGEAVSRAAEERAGRGGQQAEAQGADEHAAGCKRRLSLCWERATPWRSSLALQRP